MSALITHNSEVIFHFSIKLEDGSVADSTKVNNKPAKLVIGDGNLSAGFEACLLGLTAGEQREFRLPPEQAFGLPNQDNIHFVDRARFTAEAPAEVGNIILFTQPDGAELPGIVREVIGDSVTIDFNHPLAGHTVIFDVEILSVS